SLSTHSSNEEEENDVNPESVRRYCCFHLRADGMFGRAHCAHACAGRCYGDGWHGEASKHQDAKHERWNGYAPEDGPNGQGHRSRQSRATQECCRYRRSYERPRLARLRTAERRLHAAPSAAAMGATILVEKGNEPVVRPLLEARHTQPQDELDKRRNGSQGQPVGMIEVYEGKKVISEGGQSFELYPITGSPHVDPMVLGYASRAPASFQ